MEAGTPLLRMLFLVVDSVGGRKPGCRRHARFWRHQLHHPISTAGPAQAWDGVFISQHVGYLPIWRRPPSVGSPLGPQTVRNGCMSRMCYGGFNPLSRNIITFLVRLRDAYKWTQRLESEMAMPERRLLEVCLPRTLIKYLMPWHGTLLFGLATA